VRGRATPCYPGPIERLSLVPAPLADDELARATDTASALVAAVGRAVRAPESRLRAAVACLLAGGHLMIEDVPGVGKTVLAKSLARAAGLSFSRLQCTADLLPSDVTGVHVFDQARGEFAFRPGPVFANLLLVDEINRASPRTQSALLECMEEAQVTVDGRTMELPRPFMVMATQNPVEYEGTFPLPEAQLDRFSLRLSLGYPAPEQEAAMLLDVSANDPLERVHAQADEAGLRSAVAAVERVHVEPALARYVVDLAAATRGDARLRLGASPRAALVIVRVARAVALMAGRNYTTPEDVKAVAPLALAHRLVVGPEGRAAGLTAEAVVAEALARVPIPT
jgi:MoxR-like ATPase